MQTLAKHLNLISTNIKNKNLLATDIQLSSMHSNWYPLKQKDPHYITINLVIIHCHGYSHNVNFNSVSPQSSAGKKCLLTNQISFHYQSWKLLMLLDPHHRIRLHNTDSIIPIKTDQCSKIKENHVQYLGHKKESKGPLGEIL